MTTFADAESEYSKDKKIRKEDVQVLQEWIKKQPHLPAITEFKIILFLQCNYYRIEATKICIDKYYTIRTQCPEFFANRTAASVKHMMELTTAVLLPKSSINGYRILFCKIMDPNNDNFSNIELMKYFDMVATLILAKSGTAEGHVLVVDMEGVSLSHITKVNINMTRKYMYFLQEALPIRAKEIHILNITPLAQRLMNLIKSFIRKDILDSLYFHTTIDGLFEFIAKESLPKEYGGGASSIKDMQASINKDLEDNRAFFAEDEKEKADESKRIGEKKKYLDDEPEMIGNFKKLDID